MIGGLGAENARVLILTVSFGGGHEAVAGELRQRFERRGHEVQVVDLLQILPFRTGGIARRIYELQIRRSPRMYDFFYRHRVCWWPTMLLGIVLSARAIRRTIAGFEPDIAVSTYPWACHVLGRQHRLGRLPAVTTVHTDYAPHEAWVHRGVQRHLALHPRHAEAIAAYTDAEVVVSGPIISDRFGPANGDRAAARERLGLPADGRLAMVTGGAWGVGDLEDTARGVALIPGWQPVVLCGRHDRLRDRLAAEGWTAVGWTDEMPDFMHACDAVVDTTGGVTGQEARQAGLPVLSFRPIAGHGRDSAELLEAVGMTHVSDSLEDLVQALAALPAPVSHPDRVGAGTDAVDLILGVRGPTPAHRMPSEPAVAS